MLKPHIHEKLIKAWADGAQIEYYSTLLSRWSSVAEPCWSPNVQYRVAKTTRTIIFNGARLEQPVNKPNKGETYYTPVLWADGNYSSFCWKGDTVDLTLWGMGLVFSSAEMAEKYSKLSLTFTVAKEQENV